MPENKHLRFFVILLYCALALLGVWLFFKYAFVWFAPFILAFLVSRLIDKPVTFFHKKLKFPKPIASALFTILFYGIIGTIFYFSISTIIGEVIAFVEKLPKEPDIYIDYIQNLSKKAEDIFNVALGYLPLELQDYISISLSDLTENLSSTFQEFFVPLIPSATGITIDVAKFFPATLIFVIAAIVSTYFFSNDYDFIKSKIASVTPPKWRARYHQTKNQISVTLVSYLRALLVLVCITFVELSIGFTILRVPNSILVAAIVAAVDALPLLGTGWVLLPWGIVAILMGNYHIAIGLAIIYAVIVIVRNILEPKIVGNNIGLHPLVTLCSMYVGLKLFGVVGMFMPIPIALLKQFYEWGYFDFLKHTTGSGKNNTLN